MSLCMIARPYFPGRVMWVRRANPFFVFLVSPCFSASFKYDTNKLPNLLPSSSELTSHVKIPTSFHSSDSILFAFECRNGVFTVILGFQSALPFDKYRRPRAAAKNTRSRMYGQWKNDSLSAASVRTLADYSTEAEIQKIQPDRKSRARILHSHCSSVFDTGLSSAGGSDPRVGDWNVATIYGESCQTGTSISPPFPHRQ